MEYEAMKAVIEDGGGYDNVVRLVFDNAICTNYASPGEENLKESDFVNLGGTWFYKEPSVFRSNDTFDYDVLAYNYHPLDCLQSIIMSNEKHRFDIMSINDMLTEG